MFKGSVIRIESLDPNYKVRFTFSNETYEIMNGEALFTRQYPFPKVTFNDYTDYVIEKYEVDEVIVKNIKLEIGQIVFDYNASVQGKFFVCRKISLPMRVSTRWGTFCNLVIFAAPDPVKK